MERADFEQWKSKEVARLLALVETERRYYQEMVASLPIALVVLSADRSIVSVNRAFRKTVGLRTDELLGKIIDQVLPSDRLTETIRNAHLQGMPNADVYLNVSGRPFRVAVVPIRNWDDETELETLLAVEDLSAIHAQIEAQIEAQLRAQTTTQPPVETEIATRGETAAPEAPQVEEAPVEEPAPAVPAPDIPAVVWQADAETLAFTSLQGAAEQLLGYPPSHWLETPNFFSERIHPNDRDSTMEFYKAAIQRGGDASAEYRAISASGAEVWCRETIRSAAEGMPRLLHGVITNITRRKQLEDQLLTAQRSQALHSLASRLSHDLNNPLMIVTGYGEEMLQALSPEDPMRADIQEILTASERIAGITGQLLEFTRRQANPPEPVNVLSLLAELQTRIVEAAGESVTVEFALANSPVWALADAEQLEQVILAVLSAMRGGAQGRTHVTVACKAEIIFEQPAKATLRPGVYASVVIHDNGRGLDADKSAAIFEGIIAPKASEPVIPPAESLTRAYAIVREWSGDIAFSSEPSRGSTFSIYLPYTEPEPEPEPRVETPTQEPGLPASETIIEVQPEPRRETILVVEDEPGIRSLVRKILRRERYHVLEAGSGEEALGLAETEGGRIDLLLTDVMLPGMPGRAVAERLRERIPDLDILYISGFTDDEAVRTGDFPPGSQFLQKPFTLGALVGKVRAALDA